MTADRQHHYLFAHRFLPKQTFENPDLVMRELSGPMAEAFIFFAWQQVANAVETPMSHIGRGTRAGSQHSELLKLAVLGADQQAGYQFVVLSMPPALAPGEAELIVIVRNHERLRYFTLERSAEGEAAVMGEWTSTGMHIAYGPVSSADAASFLRAVGSELGVELPVGPTAPTAATDFAQPASETPGWARALAFVSLGVAVLLVIATILGGMESETMGMDLAMIAAPVLGFGIASTVSANSGKSAGAVIGTGCGVAIGLALGVVVFFQGIWPSL